MPVHVLRETQVIPAPVAQCWAFFADPRNLARITPPDLGLNALGEFAERMHPGMMIQYRVRPLFGIPVTWLTEITHVDEPHYFVDEQRIGPYRLWHHEHHFRAVDDTHTEMRDIIHYALKGSPFTEIAHPWLVRPALKKIFAHRQRVIREVFASPPPA